jgi:hypothetical protein
MFDANLARQSALSIPSELLPLSQFPTAGGSGAVMFVDRRVADFESLIAGATAEVFVLDETQDGIAQISQVLAGRRDLSAIHIVSHGSAGDLLLGRSGVNQGNLGEYEAALVGWKASLTEDADILLYGCEVGQGSAGLAFVQRLAEVTGADVAASDDLTGNTALGGDWELEYQTGAIETDTLKLTDYASVLATFSVTNTNDSGAGSLRDAIDQANTAVGADTIDFTGATFADATPDTITLASELSINSDIALTGTGANLLTVSGNNVSRIFNITSGTVSLSRLSLSNGKAVFGGAILNAGGLSIQQSEITNNQAVQGGGIYNSGTLQVDTSTFSANKAIGNNGSNGGNYGGGGGGGGAGLGGAIFDSATATIINSTLSGNQAQGGQGGQGYYPSFFGGVTTGGQGASPLGGNGGLQ